VLFRSRSAQEAPEDDPCRMAFPAARHPAPWRPMAEQERREWRRSAGRAAQAVTCAFLPRHRPSALDRPVRRHGGGVLPQHLGVVALGVHLLLATANIVFWSGFSAFGMVAAGIVATTGHLLLVTAHLIAIASVSRKVPR
jgi:hypothetical protein